MYVWLPLLGFSGHTGCMQARGQAGRGRGRGGQATPRRKGAAGPWGTEQAGSRAERQGTGSRRARHQHHEHAAPACHPVGGRVAFAHLQSTCARASSTPRDRAGKGTTPRHAPRSMPHWRTRTCPTNPTTCGTCPATCLPCTQDAEARHPRARLALTTGVARAGSSIAMFGCCERERGFRHSARCFLDPAARVCCNSIGRLGWQLHRFS